MKQEDKELLLKDLCARLPYGVKGRYNNMVMSLHMINPFDNYCPLYCVTESGSKYIGIDEFKPYLLPLSSMTEEQKKEYCSLVWFDGLSAGWNRDDAVILNEVEMLIDFYHKNHLDWRGLIDKSLALDATGLNIY